MPAREPTKPKNKSGVSWIEVTPDVIEAVTDELIECGRLRDTYFQAPDRERVRQLAEEILSVAAVASKFGYETAVAHLKDD